MKFAERMCGRSSRKNQSFRRLKDLASENTIQPTVAAPKLSHIAETAAWRDTA
jgi:hypothetical protein